ncbi:MAG TPA: outer membrane lipoprotein carrier protein LolA [Usitatibacter sp.]|nr:outer membrane lipoprotein carrier protein LolA [Usitatibacter sp.]
MSAAREGLRIARAALLLAAALLADPAARAAWDIGALMALLRAHPPGRAHFDETKTVSILDRPLQSSGELVFTPPGRLEKHVTSPGDERVVADGERLVIERAGKRQVIALAEHPEVAVLIESIRGTLAGDRAALERAYRLRLAGDAASWRLELTPRDASLEDLVTKVAIEGSQARVERVEIEQADGDRSLMQIRPGTG